MPIVFVVIVFYLTKNEPKIYSTNASVYTGIATGSSIVSMEDSKLDLFGSRTAFDNLINIIKSRSTIEEVALRLFTSHMVLENPPTNIIQRQSYNELTKLVPAEVKELVVKGDYEKTLQKFRAYRDSDYSNFIYELINFNHKNYSSKKILSRVRVSRVQSSDLVEIIYEADDPGICQHTLEILIEVFIENYSNIKVNQSDAVVRYFLGQLDQSNERLNQAENELLKFNRSNSIINYYEQTKHIASEKEHFDLTYGDIKMQHAAAEAVLKLLESKMTVREKAKVNSQEIIDLRNQLARVNLEIAMKSNQDELDQDGEKNLIGNLSALQNQSYQLQQQLRTAISDQYNIDNTAEGLPTEKILQDWLDKMVEFETTKAQMEIGDEKHLEFKQLFRDYAPLGATMKRLERKIDVAEREYLSLLHSLSLAKLKQQNIELNSNLKIIAAPIFPIEAKPSKRKFLLVIAFMIGFVLPAFTIIVLEFLDQNIKNTFHAQNRIGLAVAAIFPVLDGNKRLDFDFVKQRGLDIIARRLILNTESVAQKQKPDINLFFSVLDGEGKSLLLINLLSKLSEFGYRILLLAPGSTIKYYAFDILGYTINNNFHRVESVYDLEADWTGIVFEDYDYVFIEIPGILKNSYPIKLFKTSHHSFLVTRANRAWSKADQNALKDILEFTGENKPQILLNGVALEEMESVLGDLPKNRTFIRRIIKNLIRLQFFAKQKLVSKDEKAGSSYQKENKRWIVWLAFLLLVVAGIAIGGKVYLSSKQVPKNPVQSATQTAPLNQVGHDDLTGKTSNEEVTSKEEDQVQQPVIQIKYYVIGGTFRSAENANESYLRYKALGYSPEIIEETGSVFKVAVGVYPTKDEAEKVKTSFNRYVPNADAWIQVSSEIK